MTVLRGPSAQRLGATALCCALSACVAPVPPTADQATAAPLRVTNAHQPFAMSDGLAARRMAEAECARQGKRLRPGIYDRFDAGAWVYPGGCA
ncbi:MAG: hypothetical protein ACK4HF_03630 [Paracoccaceae bacterium]